jgi:hypothetical protein
MADFHVRSDSVDVEQIMRQIRARIREKRGADYTEAEIQQLANVKLEKFLDPKGVRSTLVEAFKKNRVVHPELPAYTFTDATLFETQRGWLRPLRRLFKPILQLFFNPDRVSAAFMQQQAMNADFYKRIRQREDMDPLYFEVIHNLVLEITRLGIEVQNLKMRAESVSSRLDFDERRARSLEGMVQRRVPEQGSRGPERGSERGSEGSRPPQGGAPPQVAAANGPQPAQPQAQPGTGGFQPAQGQGPRTEEQRERRRRRRRRRRRPGQNLATGEQGTPAGGPQQAGQAGASSFDAEAPDSGDDYDGGDDGPDGGDDEGGGSGDAHQ